ncbi:MAG: TonB-dependent receptor [Bacteroidales bacterium]|nr:TonB-dependent receptor [Bacteroidales bacterium]
MKTFLLTTAFCILSLPFLRAQQITQTIRGTVVELHTETPVIGASVVIVNSKPLTGTTSNEKGEFRLEKVPVGRHTLQISFIGYKTVTLPALELISGKELVLKIALEENVTDAGEVIIKANSRKDKPLNDMAVVSARSFTVEQTERYAGSWGDPARMTQNFAGVMVGSDQVNAIIIRGNSPSGLLWKLEGVPVPNPNHFGDMGSTSGPISMLNNNVLNNSDFFSGAFPAQYGNATSGVFDLGLRTGNNEKHEFLGQVGFNGFELGAEGPFSKKSDASYLVNYRYSTMGVMDALGIDIGVGAIPYYQDLALKIDLPGNSFGRLTLFGLGGKNNITFDDENDYNRRNYTDYRSKVGTLGLSHLIRTGENARFKTTVAATYHGSSTLSDSYKNDVLEDSYGDDFTENRIFVSEEFRSKLSVKDNIILGVNAEAISMSYLDSIYLDDQGFYVHHFDLDDNLVLMQAYGQWQHKFTNRLSAVTGLHFQKISINDELAVEPRLSLQWQLNDAHAISLGYGLHSQMQARNVYFREVLLDTLNQLYSKPNKNLGFSKSHHIVLGYNLLLNENLRLKTEAYYQALYDLPVKQYPSSISTINADGGYYGMNLDSLVNKGTGRNMGIEITFERFLTGSYYYLATLSVFDSKYKASDGKWRNTAYNGNYVFNALGGYEFELKKNNSLAVDLKFTWAGGMRSIPIDLQASLEEGSTEYDFDHAFEKAHDDYYRVDLRIAFRMNRSKYSQEWGLDITNLTNHKNRFFDIYNPDTGEIEEASQMGIVPVMLWRIRF